MSADRLREAAKVLRDPVRCNRPAYEDALADWLDAEADGADLMKSKGAALNFLIATSFDGDDRRWRVALDYTTAPLALKVADAILGSAA